MSIETLRNATFDLADMSVREVNRALQAADAGSFSVAHPNGAHALACGLNAPVDVSIVTRSPVVAFRP